MPVDKRRDGIFRRANGVLYAYSGDRVDRGLPGRKSLKTKDMAEAKRRYRVLMETDWFKGTDGERTGQISIRKFFDLYLEDYCKPPKKTRENYQKEGTRLGTIWEFLRENGCGVLSDISPQVAERLISHLTSKDASPIKGRGNSGLPSTKTVNHYMGHLKTALSVAVRWGYLDFNPISHVKPLKRLEARAPRFFTEPEIHRILDAADQAAADYMRLVLYTGLRLWEMANLRWGDVDMERERLTVQSGDNPEEYSPKSRKFRYVDLGGNALRFFDSLPREGDYVFSNKRGRRRYKQKSNYERPVRKALEAAGLYEQGVNLHAFRHTYGTTLAQNGAPLMVIKELMGHSRIETTMIYLHSSEEYRKKAAETIDFER